MARYLTFLQFSMHASLVCQNGIEFSEQSVLILLGDIPYTVSRKLKTDINTLQDSIVLTLRASPQAVGYGVHVYIYIYINVTLILKFFA